MSKIYHEPSTLNEWTLEMNINHEILSMFSNVYVGSYSQNLREIFYVQPLISLFNPFRKRGFVYKLTPVEEGAGGGWDGKIVIPKSLGRDKRVIFIQYKRGNHSEGNNESGSIFNITSMDSKHIEFSFNSNNNKNQHQYLKNLVDDLASNNNSNQIVMYAFPRISSKEQFEELAGSLLLYTTFLTVSQMDYEANNAGINLYDNQEHKFRTCYVNANRREICSSPFHLKEQDKSIDVLYEIMAFKIGYFWNEIYYNFGNINLIKDELKLVIADYLKVNPFNSKLAFNPAFEGIFFNYFKNIEEERIILEKKLFPSELETNYFQNNRLILYKKLAKFIDNIESQKINLIKDIPKIFTQPVDENFSINLNKWKTNATLSYQII